MYEYILRIIKISRYRFWSYTAGTYFLGCLLGSLHSQNLLLKSEYIVTLIYFLIPANIFLYGINDYFDQDTDIYNPKKGRHEYKLHNRNRQSLRRLLIVCLIISLLLLFSLPSFISQIIFLIFIFLSVFYSAPPIRFKSKPFLDSASNILYVLPGIIGFIQSSGSLPDLSLIAGLWCWAAAMHLFSAIPDITADTKAGLKTTAVVLGTKSSLILCSLLWMIFLMIFAPLQPFFLTIILMIYPSIPLLVFFYPSISINKIYWLYPYINNLVGFIVFVTVISHNWR